jgi:hypothetical protein
MRRFLGCTTLIAAGLAGLAAVPAHGAKITMGSDLKANATKIEAHGQDSAFWQTSVRGKKQKFPADGQVIAVTVKGTVLTEEGAAPPANLIHFQSLLPENGVKKRVWLSSQGFYLPIDQPNAVTTFEPENLCVKKGGSLAFNDIGGFKWGGSLDAPLDDAPYLHGAPFQIFAPVTGSVTPRYSASDKTNNGDLLNPLVGHDPGAPNGSINRGQELLMRYVVATGRDRSEPCGGPRRHPDGTLVAPKVRELRVAGQGLQRPYVTKDKRFTVGLYCESPDEGCDGTAELLRKGRPLLAVPGVSVGAQSSSRLPLKLTPDLFRQLDKTGSLLVELKLKSQWGTKITKLLLKR